ncbi:NADH-dependent flavin oxidoreductase-like protein [Amniculicola lignicola CBS 123094]|uniref:NADH-dependent flavin oxidoreductase-like protein n=1 Tax=Amniculicola lignicola CBS 123094 TaxID=1392246 RepID=A0A6A5WT24_9PLEO|nr:NADH-dependent flavin oxidoreductase-like protein [Amniculicola lignicola CBS 123094]
MAPPSLNQGVPNLPYFTPNHAVSPGTPVPNPKSQFTAPIPTLFRPLTIRGKTLRNRIIVAPMCQYSTAAFGPDTGALTDYHIATLGHYALKGSSLVIVEASGVQSNGRISPNCPGLWDDKQIPALRRVSDFIKSQGALSGIQLAHAGRKASTTAPWVAGSGVVKKVSMRAERDAGGWPEDVVGPMGGESEIWDGRKEGDEKVGYWAPRGLTVEEIETMVGDWGRAAKRAVEAGVDVIEIHAAHGYLVHQFLSPVTNRRTDRYGGSFENRIRLLVEIITEVRKSIPDSTPLFLRISSTEWLENTEIAKTFGGSWTVEDSIQLAKLLPDLGIDLLDVSSGGNHPGQQINMFDSKDYQIKIAARIRAALQQNNQSLLIGAVGLITEAEQARDILEEGGATALLNGGANAEIEKEALAAVKMTEGKEPMADVVLVARQFMREPEWVLKVAWKLGVDVAWPSQFLRVRFPKL